MVTLFFTKAKRAQSNEDYETWVAGGVVPTLNRMDNNGEAFATVLAVFPIQDGREVEKHQNGLGVGNENDPAYTVDTVSRQAVVMRDREGKPGGGEGTANIGDSFYAGYFEFSYRFP